MAVFAVIFLCCSVAYASDYCDTKYREMMVKLKNTDKIQEKKKTTYLLSLEKAYQLCKQDKMEEARRIMDEFKDQFVHDALMNQQQFYGN